MKIRARKEYVRKSNFHGTFWIVDTEYRRDRNKNHRRLYYKIYFPNTGYTTWSDKSSVDAGKIKDFRNPVVCGVGYLGDDFKKIYEEDPKLCTELRCRWKSMLQRCYSKKNKNYSNFYADVTVDERWYNFSIFYKDAQELDGYSRDMIMSNHAISLDKDKLQQGVVNKVYSKDTCCWLTPKEQQIYTPDHGSVQKKKKFIVTFPDGHKERFEGSSEFARLHNLDNSDIGKCLKGTKNHVKGYKFREIKE